METCCKIKKYKENMNVIHDIQQLFVIVLHKIVITYNMPAI